MNRGTHKRQPGDRVITVWIRPDQLEYLNNRHLPDTWYACSKQDTIRDALDGLIKKEKYKPKKT